MLAGLPKAPSTFNPIANPERALVRRNWILSRMESLDKIDQSEHQLAMESAKTAEYHGTKLDLNAPYIAEMARRFVLDLYGDKAYTEGYQVVTTVKSDKQASAQLALINGTLEYDKRHGYRGSEQQLIIPEHLQAEVPPIEALPLEQLTQETLSKESITQQSLSQSNISAIGQVSSTVTAEANGLAVSADNSALASLAKDNLTAVTNDQAELLIEMQSLVGQQPGGNHGDMGGDENSFSFDNQIAEKKPELPAWEAAISEHWLPLLAETPVIGGLEPVAVVRLSEVDFTVLMADGSLKSLAWKEVKSQFRPYISEDRRGSTPKFPSDALTIGDVIRLRPQYSEKTLNSYELASNYGKNQDNSVDRMVSDWVVGQVPDVQAAIVALDPDDGAVQALVGGFDFNQSHYNRVLQAERQPGSNFKPFIYAVALEQGYTAASLINDAPIVFEDAQLEADWRPVNSSRRFLGPTPLRRALYQSRNMVSIRLLNSMGLGSVIDTLERFGFNPSDLPRDLSLALGTHAVTPLKIATAYATLANGGYKVDPYWVEEIRDRENETVYKATPLTVCRDCVEVSSGLKLDAVNAISETISKEGFPEQLATANPSALENLADQELQNLDNELADELASLESPSIQTDVLVEEVKATEAIEAVPGTAEVFPLADNLDLNSPSNENIGIEKNTTFQELEEKQALLKEDLEPALPLAPRVMDEQVVYILRSMMKDVITRGTGTKALVLKRSDLAGKTGTTNGPTDAWFFRL